MKKYRKKPVVIEAIQLEYSTKSQDNIIEWSGNKIRKGLDGGLVIPTLEGDMVANTGDYIIKGVNGEFYPCKPDIFEKTYDEVGSTSFMSFGFAIQMLKSGFAIRRSGWNGKGLFVVKQIPAHITEEIIPKMQSLPQSAKDIIMSRENKVIDYTSQMLIINPDGRADSWVPSVSDVFAEDWEIVN